MILTGVITLGRDVELKYTNSGTAVAQLNGAYNIGFGDKKETQWASFALFGKQAEALTQYLLKDGKVDVTAKDVKVDQWTKQDGSVGVTLKGIIINIDLISSGQSNNGQQGNQGQQQAPQQHSQQMQQPQQPQPVGGNQGRPQRQQQQAPNDFDDIDIGF